MKVILIKFTARRLASDGARLNRVGRAAGSDVERCQRSLACRVTPFEKCYAPYTYFFLACRKGDPSQAKHLEFVII